MREIVTTVYELREHPDKDKCFEWIRENDFFIGDIERDELILSLKALAEAIGGTVDYSIAHYACRGEHITFKGWDKDLLAELNADDCSLTGCFWDYEVITALREHPDRLLRILHNTISHLYSDESLEDMAEGNEWEFYENGERV